MSTLAPLESTRYWILLALAKTPLHGYAVYEQIIIDSRGGVRLPRDTIYKTLKRLEALHLVEKSASRTYQLTQTGQRLLKAETIRLKDAATLAQQRILF
jgi:DNA-binding PadR family transcriptional regulator